VLELACVLNVALGEFTGKDILECEFDVACVESGGFNEGKAVLS